MGEIPERTLFNQPDMRVPLLPFLHLTLAVRVGDLKAFERVEAQFADLFRRDNLLSLVHRCVATRECLCTRPAPSHAASTAACGTT